MNTQFFLFVLNFLLIAFENFIVIFLSNGLFKTKRTLSFRVITLLVLILLANLNVLFLEGIPLLKLFVSLSLYAIWIFINYSTGIAKSAFTALLLLSIQLIIDSIFTIIVVSIDPDIFSSPQAYYFVCYSSKLLELLAIILIRTWTKRHFHSTAASWANWLKVLFFPLSTFSISLYLLNILITNASLAPQLLGCSLILLASDFVSILLLDYIEKQQGAVLDNIVLKQNLKLETEHIQSLQEAYATQRKQTHDFENKLAVLHSMSKRSATQEEFGAYLESILSIQFPVVSYVNTHRLVADIIFSQKYALANINEIVFTHQLDDLSDFPLPDDALVIVLTNLLDNSIEACKNISNPDDRRILVKMRVMPDCSYLYIENTTANPVVIKGNEIATTKNHPLAHGFGLKNVYTMLERHNALYAIDYDDSSQTFRFSAKIPSAPQ